MKLLLTVCVILLLGASLGFIAAAFMVVGEVNERGAKAIAQDIWCGENKDC